MKKKISRVISIITLLAVLLCIPVSAAGTGWSDISLGYEDFFDSYILSNEDLQLDVFNLSTGLSYWVRPREFLSGDGQPVNQHPYTGVKYYLDTLFNDKAAVGHTLRCCVPLGDFGGYDVFAGEDFALTIDRFRVGLSTVFAQLDAVTFGIKCEFSDGTFSIEEFPLDLVSSGPGNYLWPSLGIVYPATKDCKVYVSYVDVTFTVKYTGHMSLAVLFPEGVNVGYGNPNSPEAPIYNKPDDGGVIDDMTNVEDDLNDATADGQEAANNIFADFASNILSFAGGLIVVTKILELFLGIPAIGSLVTISLAIGFLAFILGLGYIGLPSKRESGDSENVKFKPPRGDEKWLM